MALDVLDTPLIVDYEVVAQGEKSQRPHGGTVVPPELCDCMDPFEILVICEEIDQEEGRAAGTTLEIYLSTKSFY